MRSPRAIAISRARSLPAARASADESLRLLVRAAAAVVLIGASVVWLWTLVSPALVPGVAGDWLVWGLAVFGPFAFLFLALGILTWRDHLSAWVATGVLGAMIAAMGVYDLAGGLLPELAPAMLGFGLVLLMLSAARLAIGWFEHAREPVNQD